jgi:glyoxylase-like metal-dependent hydrolase (beta-lactamase superfamily II)
MNLNIQHFFDAATSTLSYVVWDADTSDAVIIDPVLDFDPVNLKFSEESITELLTFVTDKGLTVRHVLETHIHADHITGAARLREKMGAKLVVGSLLPIIQETFVELLNLDGSEINAEIFDVLMGDGDVLASGSLEIKAIHTPGHTPACTTYQIGDAIFAGDTLFMPDFGTGRCDFPKGSAETLYSSIKKLYELPDETRVFVGHDYQPGGRDLEFETTIGACKTGNKQLKANTPKEDFLKFRTERDAQLNLPKLIFQSVQLNIRAGALPHASENGVRMMCLPILGE